MRARTGAWRKGLLGVVILALLSACSSAPDKPSQSSAGSRPSPSTAVSAPMLGSIAKYAAAVDVAHQHGLDVWLESDLVQRWHAGPAALQEGVGRIKELSKRPGVAGVKIADELGYGDGLNSSTDVLAFLHDAGTALRGALAPEVKVLVDIVVPELGCAPDDASAGNNAKTCADKARSRYPGAALTTVDAIVASGDVDVVNVSTGLLDEATYSKWGISRDRAQHDAWAEVQRRGWSSHVTIQARKALAVPQPFPTASQAAEAVPTFVDIPASSGAQAVDVWTWRQRYRGDVVGLLGSDATNQLWQALEQRHAAGVQLMTHFSPSVLRQSVDADLSQIATVFSGVFLSAGTG